MTYPHFGELLTRMREDRGLRQQDIASAASLAMSTVSKQERSEKCHLRPPKLSRVVDYLNRVKPLTTEELDQVRELGTLPPGYEPSRATLSWDGEELDILRQRYAGKLRIACELIHNQISAESSADQYLPLLCAAARTLGVAIQLPDDPPTD